MNQERRFLLATVLSFLVLVIFYAPTLSKKTNSLPSVQKETTPLQTVSETSPKMSILSNTQLPPQFYELANEVFSVRFTTRGAGISDLVITNGKSTDNETIRLSDSVGNAAAFAIKIPSETISFDTADFKLEQFDPKNKTISFVLENQSALRVRKRYELLAGQFALKLVVELENLSDRARQSSLELVNCLNVGGAHSNYDKDQWESFVIPKIGKIKVAKATKIRKTPALVNEAVEWQALTRKYFTVAVKPQEEAVSVESRFINDQEGLLEAVLRFAPHELAPKSRFENTFLIYAGPEYYDRLKVFGFDATLTQGVWGVFRYWLFILLRFCEKITGSYGFAILLLTLLIKVLFSPLTHMSFESMRKMQTIQPKLKAIQTQFKNDPTRLNKEMMELYKRYKVNPMGGCLPMFIQIPIFVSFYQVLAQFVELKGESFLWIKDLTLPDHLAKIPYLGLDLNLLPILMIGTMIWQQKVTPQQSTTSPEQAKVMQFMPIMFGFFFYQLPSGLVLYWTVNNLLTVIHQVLFHHRAKSISED